VITNWNTPLFTNFLGTTNATGGAVAVSRESKRRPSISGMPIALK
jgi:hypothetical protein